MSDTCSKEPSAGVRRRRATVGLLAPSGGLIASALRTGGDLLMVDVKASSELAKNREIPWASWLYTVSTIHCMTVSLSAGGAGLGAAWGQELATSMLADAGFTDVHIADVDTDPFNNYYVAHR